jgi:anti-sigma regulatory factor (Ser/Thr protein kinase)
VPRFGLSLSGNDALDVSRSHPAESPRSMHELLPATLDSVGEARRAVRRFTRDLEVDVDGIVLAVSEAVANVVAHAYLYEAAGTIDLMGAASPSEVTIVVRDHGGGLSAGEDRPGAGFGLPIIRQLAQRVDLRDTSEGVALSMSFRRGRDWSVH